MDGTATSPIPPDLRPYLDTIADRLLSGHAAVMVGAGFSRNAASPGSGPGFPNWSELGDRFYERLHGHKPGRDCGHSYLHVPVLAHEVEAAFGRPLLNQMLRDAIPDLQHEPSPLHVTLLDLPWSDVFTTNYDTLLGTCLPFRHFATVRHRHQTRGSGSLETTTNRQAPRQSSIGPAVHRHRRGLPAVSSRLRSLCEHGTPSPPGKYALSDWVFRR